MDIEKVKGYLVGLALAEHPGDVNDYLPLLCDALDLPRPTWSDRYHRYEMAWEEPREEEDEDDTTRHWDR